MEAMSISECTCCIRIIIPGEEVYLHRGELVCASCHRVTRFAGLALCDR